MLSLLGVGAVFTAAKSAKAQSEVGGANMTEAQIQRRLLRRITYGATEDDVKLIKTMGYEAYLEWQLNPDAIDDTACDNAVGWYSTVFFDERNLFKVREDVAKHELVAATILRATMSKRQLYQRMVEFWTDHLNIYFDKVGVLKVVHDRDVIRKHALGNFRTMLMANMKSPAMLVYLDNQDSYKTNPNQNLAREFFELHSLGVNGGYTQADVLGFAKCLTGWTVRLWPWDAPDIGKFIFDKSMHYNGTKTVLGREILSDGWIKDGETVITLASGRKNTGRFLAKKLCRFFLGFEPDTALVEEIASEFIATSGDIKAMLRIVLRRQNIMAAPLMMKRPFHYTIGLLRQTKATVGSLGVIRDELYEMGQHPFEWPPPNGYPHASGYWIPQLLPRWNFSYRLFFRELEKNTIVRANIVKDAVTLEEVLARINSVFFAGEMNGSSRTAIRAALVDDATALSRSLNACSLAVTLPGYEKC